VARGLLPVLSLIAVICGVLAGSAGSAIPVTSLSAQQSVINFDDLPQGGLTGVVVQTSIQPLLFRLAVATSTT
jgi:hypothetical protein